MYVKTNIQSRSEDHECLWTRNPSNHRLISFHLSVSYLVDNILFPFFSVIVSTLNVTKWNVLVEKILERNWWFLKYTETERVSRVTVPFTPAFCFIKKHIYQAHSHSMSGNAYSLLWLFYISGHFGALKPSDIFPDVPPSFQEDRPSPRSVLIICTAGRVSVGVTFLIALPYSASLYEEGVCRSLERRVTSSLTSLLLLYWVF